MFKMHEKIVRALEEIADDERYPPLNTVIANFKTAMLVIEEEGDPNLDEEKVQRRALSILKESYNKQWFSIDQYKSLKEENEMLDKIITDEEEEKEREVEWKEVVKTFKAFKKAAETYADNNFRTLNDILRNFRLKRTRDEFEEI